MEIIERAALRRLLEVIGGDPDDLNELLEDYQGIAPELAERIRFAAGAGDVEALRVAAHTLKSNALEFGAMHLASLCGELERVCRDRAEGDFVDMAEQIVSAEEEARKTLRDLGADGLAD